MIYPFKLDIGGGIFPFLWKNLEDILFKGIIGMFSKGGSKSTISPALAPGIRKIRSPKDLL